MQIQPIQPGAYGQNSTYDAASMAAQHAQFSEELRRMQAKADAAVSPEEADAERQRKELRDACQGFEAMFLNMMYREMRKTVPKDELFGESNAMDIFRDMHDTEVMQQLAASGGIGLADLMYKQLSPQVEKRIEAAQKMAAEQQESR